MKPDATRHSMTRRPRKNLPQAHLSRLMKKMDKTYYSDRYKNAFKAASLAVNIPDSEKGKHGIGIDSICERINKEMLSSPASTLRRAIHRGDFGISPKKLGRKSTLPKEFTQALAVHSVMMQVSGLGVGSDDRGGAVGRVPGWGKTAQEYAHESPPRAR